MLRNIDPRLSADMLYALRAMGHGDELVICDTNFPADATARKTPFGRPIAMHNLGAADVVEAILSVMPLDTFVDHAAFRMEVVGSADEVPDVMAEVQAVLDRTEGAPWPLGAIERFAFYDRADTAYCVVASGERRFYGNVILTKGVIPPPDA